MNFDEDPKPSEERLREALEDTDAGAAIEKSSSRVRCA
jgi:hypothetical protein